MSFIYKSDNTKDNEKKKFQPDNAGETAVNVLSNNLEQLLTQILAALGGSSDTVPNIYNVDCAVIGTEYSLALPADTKGFILKSRKSAKLDFSYSSGATDTLTINSGSVFEDKNFYSSQTIYFKSNKADDVVEVIAYV